MSGMKRGVAVAVGGIGLLALFWGLWFAGVVSFGEKSKPATEENGPKTEESSPITEENRVADGQNDTQERVWDIVFKGMKFTIPEKGKALIHESGCLNIRQNEHYVIQIDIEEYDMDYMWGRMEHKRESLIEAGYRIEKEAERLTGEGRECIRYVISMEKERGSEYDHLYYEVLLMPADEERHFLAVIRYDRLDVENLDEAERDKIYEEALEAAEAIVHTARPTDESDDEEGTFWYEDKSLNPEQPYLSEDTLEYGDEGHGLSYRLSGNCWLISDNVAGKTYLDTVNQVYIQTNVLKYTWKTAEDMAKTSAEAELSRIHTEGAVEVSGRTFYYYTYSVLEYGKNKMTTHYYFQAFCDLEDGRIYTIYGRADDYPTALEETYYLDWMDISLF